MIHIVIALIFLIGLYAVLILTFTKPLLPQGREHGRLRGSTLTSTTTTTSVLAPGPLPSLFTLKVGLSTVSMHLMLTQILKGLKHDSDY